MPDESTARWAARPVQAGLIRAVVFVVPFAGSVLFVHFASALVAVPTSSFWLFVSWWVAMSGGATVVLFAIDRLARRLLPLVALYKLSLVFPDSAPSRFRTAMRSNTVETLQERVARARTLNDRSTPVEAAERLLALVAELDSHDRLTRGHSERVRAYARLIAGEMHLGSHELDLLNWAALLHDVGKLNVPAEILTKPGRPSEAEWEVLRRHPEFGAALVAPLREWLGQWSEAVEQHHERWDGNGYPHGIAGDQIALAGRIVAVADVFDVITSVRSYKSAFASTAARDEIAKCAGTQFDPRVVRAFLNISLGRLRLVMGPLSWLAHVPILGRLPLTPAIGTVTASLGTVAATLVGGFVATPPTVAAAAATAAPAHIGVQAQTLRRVTHEDQSLTIGLESAEGGAKVISLRVSRPPAVGRVRVSPGLAVVYSPPPNFSGHVSVGYRACWSGRGCRDGVVLVTVVPVNDPPVARDDVASTRPGTSVLIKVLGNDSDPEGDPLSIASISDVSAGHARIVGRGIRWTPPAGFVGRASFRYTANDGHGGSASALVIVDVTRAGASPPATAGAPPPAPPKSPPRAPKESPPAAPAAPPAAPPPPGDHPPRAVADQLSLPEGGTALIDVLANDSDPDGDKISLIAIGTPAHGRAERAGDRVQFSAPADFVGQVSFPYTIVDAQGARDSAQVTVSVLLVNAAPTFSPGPDQSVLEDSGPQTSTGWAKDIGPGATSEAGQTVSFLVTSDNDSLFSAQPALSADGTLSYTPATNANGSAIVTVRAKDDGGTANGGNDTGPPRTFAITVKAVNDPPSFTGGPDQTVAESAGAQTVDGWATNIEAGPANESAQTVSFLVSNSKPALFTAAGQPRVAANGTLRYTPVANANGTATVTVRAKDDGGTADGGIDTSPPQTFTVTIRPVNDPPSFTAGANQTVLEDAGPQTVNGWATNISPGPANESSQSVSFLVANDNNSLFASQPAIAANGTLNYTPAVNANGVATVTVRAKDDGGTANGGNDTSPAQTFTITVTPVNDPPVASPDSATVAEDDPSGVTFNVLANDSDVDVGDTLSVSSFDASTIANGTLTDNGGGSFTYIPDPGFIGTETFSYVASDGNGGTDSATVTITVTPVQHPPVAGDDAYTTPQDTALNVAAPGVLSNDGDPDGNPITLQTTPISAPSNGVVALAGDGSFTYTPNSGFSGSDSFSYRIDDGTGRTADGTVTITVTSSPPLASTLYFQASGPTADIWDMTLALPPAAPQLADFDADGKPGLTLKNSDGKETITESAKYQIWTYTTPSPLLVNGPVTLDLWSSTGLFGSLKAGTLYAYLYNCTAGGVICTKIASNTIVASPWNTSLIDWGHRTVTIGTVSQTIPAGNELRIKLLFKSSDLWLTMSAAYPSALNVTLG